MTFTLPIFAAVTVVAVALQWCYQRYWVPHRQLARIPTVKFEDGKGDGRERYLDELKDLIRHGYKRYTKNGQMFKSKSSYGTWRVIIPDEALREIKVPPATP